MESPLSVSGQKFSEASTANSAAERLCPFRDLCAQAWNTPSPTMCEDHNKQGYFLNDWKVVPSAIWTKPYWLSILMWDLNIISLKFQRHGLRSCYSLYMSFQSLGQEYVKLSFAVVLPWPLSQKDQIRSEHCHSMAMGQKKAGWDKSQLVSQHHW